MNPPLIGALIVSASIAGPVPPGSTGSPLAPAATEALLSEASPVVGSPATRLTVEYYAPETPQYQAYRRFLAGWGGIDSVSAELSSVLRLPQTVLIAFGECGEVTAFYQPSRNRVVLCYELFDSLLGLFSQMSGSEEEAVSSATGALLWIFLHETGHALADLLELPLTGREEDAVDQFALHVLLGMEGGADAATKGVVALLGLSEAAGDRGAAGFWDEHSFAEQRFANVMCWLYGSDPGAYAPLADMLIREAGASERRLARCEEEHDQFVQSWTALLQPHRIRTRGGTGHTLPQIPTSLGAT